MVKCGQILRRRRKQRLGFGELKSFPTLLGAPHGTLRTSPQNCNPPSPAFCTSGGPVHLPSSALAPSEPSSPAPQSHVELHSGPQNAQGTVRGTHIDTNQPGPLGHATLHMVHAQRARGGRPTLCPPPGSSPNKYPINGTSYSLRALVLGCGDAPQSGSSCSSSSSFRPLVVTMWSSCFMYRSRSCMKWGMRVFSRTPNFFSRFTSS